MDAMKLYIFHTGKVRVDRAIPLWRSRCSKCPHPIRGYQNG